MELLKGIGASSGVAIGVAHLLDNRFAVCNRRVPVEGVQAELARLDAALRQADEQLARLQEQLAVRERDETLRRIIEAHRLMLSESHRLMLSDVHLAEQTRKLIRDEHIVAEWALLKALDQIEAVFERIEDPYFRDRRTDFAVVGLCVLYHLGGMDDSRLPEGGTVVAAHELSAADIAQLGHAGAAGLCTEGGGRTSHTSIIARTLGLPYVAGIGGLGDRISSGMTLVIDGFRGEVILDPEG